MVDIHWMAGRMHHHDGMALADTGRADLAPPGVWGGDRQGPEMTGGPAHLPPMPAADGLSGNTGDAAQDDFGSPSAGRGSSPGRRRMRDDLGSGGEPG